MESCKTLNFAVAFVTAVCVSTVGMLTTFSLVEFTLVDVQAFIAIVTFIALTVVATNFIQGSSETVDKLSYGISGRYGP